MMRFFPHTAPTRRKSTAQLLEDAAGWHRKAIGYFKHAEVAARARESDSAAAARRAAAMQSTLVRRVNDLTKSLLPGWLGDPLTRADLTRPFGQDALVGQFTCVRVGDTMPISGATFPVGAPFLGAGHLVIDKDGQDPAVARWLRGVLLRSLAAVPVGQLRVLTIDGATLGEVFAPFTRLFVAEVWDVPATDAAGLRAVMEQAERHVKAVLTGKDQGPQVLLIAAAGLPSGISPDDLSRLERLAMVGASRRMHLVIAGWPPAGIRTQAVPRLHDTTYLTAASSGCYSISRPAALRQLGEGGSDGTIRLDKGPDHDVVDHVCRRSLSTAAWTDRPDFGSVTAKRFWQLSSAAGLTAVIGKNRHRQRTLDLNDETPHMLIGGRSGAGKTNFLLVLLCSLATHYAPSELAMYLLDFKEGVSFSAFTPSAPGDPWLPHAHTVGLESDREYGLAVLARLTQEMSNRARLFRNASVTTIERYRGGDPDRLMPRLLVVVDEFQVLLAGNDHIAREAVSFLERLARQGRSHGIHLILASQTLAGIDALNARKESIFGQFPLRIALPGGGGVLQPGNTTADAIGVGAAIVNSSAGLTEANTITYIPEATHDSVAARVQALWQNGRAQLTAPPAVFDGSAEYRLEDSPYYHALAPVGRHRRALIGLAVDVGLPAAGFVMNRVPGRHVAILGTAPVGAGILRAAALSLARQHQPGTARFVILDPADVAASVVAVLIDDLTSLGHDAAELDVGYLLPELANLAGQPPEKPTYIVAFGMDTAVSMLTGRGPNGRKGLDDLRSILRLGPLSDVHLISWWQGSRRFLEAIGGSAGREDVACLVIVNISGPDATTLLGDHTLSWHPRDNRCLLVDQHDHRRSLVVPFASPDLHAHTERDPPIGRAS